jgi:hypothetical protein
MGRVKPISRKRVDAAIRDAVPHGAVLDYSEESVTQLEVLISSWESMARVANDLDDGAYVGDQLGGLLDLPALGTYFGELFVRHAGAAWGEADGEDGPEPAVTRGAVTVLPLDIIRRRASDGRSVDLARIFKRAKAAMAKGRG